MKFGRTVITDGQVRACAEEVERHRKEDSGLGCSPMSPGCLQAWIAELSGHRDETGKFSGILLEGRRVRNLLHTLVAQYLRAEWLLGQLLPTDRGSTHDLDVLPPLEFERCVDPKHPLFHQLVAYTDQQVAHTGARVTYAIREIEGADVPTFVLCCHTGNINAIFMGQAGSPEPLMDTARRHAAAFAAAC